MSKLSVFVDESGDFDLKSKHSPYYLYTLVFHDQKDDINERVQILDKHLEFRKYKKHAIHTAPLIRKEKQYYNLTIDDRRVLFNQLFYFTRKVPITYQCFNYLKKEYANRFVLLAAMSRELSSFVKTNLEYFQSFEEIVVYYDNGQNEISELLNTVLSIELSNVKFKRVVPVDYKLFQVADFICTIELLSIKHQNKTLSESEKQFFYKPQELKKTFIKTIRNKKF